jgi:hypothetical protein
MKVKLKMPDHIVVGFTRREIMIINNCLNEACHGLIMDRFIPAREDLLEMLDQARAIHDTKDFYRIKKPALV